MNDAAFSLNSILAEASALMKDLTGTTPSCRDTRVERAMRLKLATETFHRVLAAELPADGSPSRSDGRRGGAYALSSRQLEVLRLIAAGHRDRQIAEVLFVSKRTVTSHVTAILNKLGAESRTAAVAYAIRVGLV
jgi:DNA-binding NarL/FixJ family response regulator